MDKIQQCESGQKSHNVKSEQNHTIQYLLYLCTKTAILNPKKTYLPCKMSVKLKTTLKELIINTVL